jgi:uncharacterized protein (TIGR02452 family)
MKPLSCQLLSKKLLSKKLNIQVWRDTVERCQTSIYPFAESIVHTSHKLLTPIPRYDKMTISVVDNDTFSCCGELVTQGLNVAALNMASNYQPGGGVSSGCFAQEENCFRRSNYCMSLKKSLYPIPETGCIYTPLITVFKDKNYDLCDTFVVSMIACAALRSPPLTPNGEYQNPSDRVLMKHKITQIFQVAYHYKIDTLVLGALGCGAFHNPPRAVAEIFNEVLHTYDKCFKRVVFAINGHNDSNYETFFNIVKTFFNIGDASQNSNR